MRFLEHKPLSQEVLEQATETVVKKRKQPVQKPISPMKVLINVITAKTRAILHKMLRKPLVKSYANQELLEQIKTLREHGRRGFISSQIPPYAGGEETTATTEPISSNMQDTTVYSEEPQINTEDLIMAIEVYKQNIPPKHQILSKFLINNQIPTSFGVAYPSRDGTQAWIVNSKGVYLATNLDLSPKTTKTIIQPRIKTTITEGTSKKTIEGTTEGTTKETSEDNIDHFVEESTDIFDSEYELKVTKPTVTTSDVINAYYNYEGSASEFISDFKDYVDTNNITDSDKSIEDGFNQIQVLDALTDPEVDTDIKTKEPEMMDYICYINIDWKKALFWMFLMNFSASVDLVRLLLQFSIKPIEEVLNYILNGLRNISIFGIKPFGWLPLVTWYEDIIYWFALNEYQIMCSFMRFKSSMRIGTNVGGKYFLEQVVKKGKLKFKNIGKMSTNQRKALAMLQMGYNWQCKVIGRKFTVAQIRQILGPVLDTQFTAYDTKTGEFID